jgi:hypothetical protein
MNMYEIGGRSGQLLLAVRRQNDIFSVYARTEIIIDSCIELIHFKHGDISKKEIIMQHAETKCDNPTITANMDLSPLSKKFIRSERGTGNQVIPK